jgi:hypothetical protein
LIKQTFTAQRKRAANMVGSSFDLLFNYYYKADKALHFLQIKPPQNSQALVPQEGLLRERLAPWSLALFQELIQNLAQTLPMMSATHQTPCGYQQT